MEDTDDEQQQEEVPATSAVAVADNHVCALDGEGRAFCWGINTDGQLGNGTGATALSPQPVQGGLSFTSIVAGENHVCALDGDGQAWCWGGEGARGTLGHGTLESSDRPVRVAGGLTFASLSRAVDDHVCGIEADGTAHCWGETGIEGRLGDGVSTAPQASPVAVAGGIAFSRIATGWVHSCGIATDGQIHCWGQDYGTTPTPLGDGRTYVDVSVGFDHTCALDSTGSAYCWGDNQSGQLGRGFPSSGGSDPSAVGGGHTFVSLSGGRDHTCGLVESGEAFCWGRNDQGQLGDGSTGQACLAADCRPSPVLVQGGRTFGVLVGGAGGNTCGIADSGDLLCWGTNVFGQLGLGAESPIGPRVVPTGPIPNVSLVDIAVGWSHACGIDDANRALCWGDNLLGQLGTGSLSATSSPAAVTGALTFAEIDVDARHSCALDLTGQAWCWGDRRSGQLGDGVQAVGEERSPVQVAGGHSFTTVDVGRVHSCAVDETGQAWCWGDNRNGQLGDPTIAPRSFQPVPVSGGLQFTAVRAGSAFTCGLEQTGIAYCWGDNTSGQLGDGSQTASGEPVAVQGGDYVALAVGRAHACGLAADGSASCWGDNTDGQLGNGTGVSANTPVGVSGSHTFSSLSAGDSHSCGVATQGQMLCWGRNFGGELGDGTTADRATPGPVTSAVSFAHVGLGLGTSCASDASGAAYCWGRNGSGQLGAGTVSRALVPVAVSPF